MQRRPAISGVAHQGEAAHTVLQQLWYGRRDSGEAETAVCEHAVLDDHDDYHGVTAMKIGDIQAAIQKYVEAEMIPKAPDMLTKVMTYTGAAIVDKKLLEMEAQYKPMAKALKIVDEEGEYDAELLHAALRDAVGKVGSVSLAGVIFNSGDVDTLFTRYMGR